MLRDIAIAWVLIQCGVTVGIVLTLAICHKFERVEVIVTRREP